MEQSEVKESGEKRGRSEQSKNIKEREKSRAKKRKENCGEKIRSESDKNSVYQIRASSVV